MGNKERTVQGANAKKIEGKQYKHSKEQIKWIFKKNKYPVLCLFCTYLCS